MEIKNPDCVEIKKPDCGNEYLKWISENCKEFTCDEEKEKTYYEAVTQKISEKFKASNFWKDIISGLKSNNEAYLVRTNYHLYQRIEEPDILIKPFSSLIEKTYRLNISQNNKWPDEPSEGWILPINWFDKINDIVRTSFVVKYLDGVDFLIGKLEEGCHKNNLTCKNFFEAREEGYYAAHLNIDFPVSIPKRDWDTIEIIAKIEIQVTTQLQDVIKNLLHKYYELRRIRIKPTEVKWQWNYKSAEFATNYLGHILHYVEGMIMEIREKQQERD
jgi:hypothetical protein